jgi:glycosyltransferase involved in cell wall biosynthesis
MNVLAYPSIEKDNCPLALLEGMASGLPVVAFDIPGVRLVVAGPDDGLLAPVENVERLAESLLRLTTDEELRCRLGRGARRRIEESFSLDRQVQRFEEAFQDLIHPKNRPSAVQDVVVPSLGRAAGDRNLVGVDA